MPTDTIYGLVGSALNKKAVKKIYEVRKRDLKKPLIILISSLDNLKDFGIDLSDKSYPQKITLNKIWPGKITLILPLRRSGLRKMEYLHRGTGKLAFRFPENDRLIKILKRAGPLVAPSANLEGEKVASNIQEAKEYFGERINFYLEGKIGSKKSSTILEWKENGFVLIREGAGKRIILTAKLLKLSFRKYSNSPTMRIQGAVSSNGLRRKKLLK